MSVMGMDLGTTNISEETHSENASLLDLMEKAENEKIILYKSAWL